MGFRCPKCKQDFGINKEDLHAHFLNNEDCAVNARIHLVAKGLKSDSNNLIDIYITRIHSDAEKKNIKMSLIGIDQSAKDHALNVCKLGQGEKCCKYLIVGSKGFECGKVRPANKNTIDLEWATNKGHIAQGDNCKGFGAE